MLMFVWFCVMTQAFVPGAAISMHTATFDAQIRAHFEEPYQPPQEEAARRSATRVKVNRTARSPAL